LGLNQLPKSVEVSLTKNIKAAEQSSLKAQFRLGFLYENREGTPEDGKQALYWYTKAVEQGYEHAQYNIGLMFAKDEGTPIEYVMAYVWWNIAAAQRYGRKSNDTSSNIRSSKVIKRILR
jgi:TPR repeat protein